MASQDTVRQDLPPSITDAGDAGSPTDTATGGGSFDGVSIENSSSKHSAKEITEAGTEEALADGTPSISPSDQAFSKDAISSTQTHIIVASLCLLYFISALDMTVLATVYIDISNDYKSLQSGVWIITSYLLATTATQPLFGKFSDILGRFEAVAMSCLFFCLGSVICASANSMTMLVAGRAVQGIGGGGLMAMPSVILGDVVSERERGKFTSFLAGSWGVASAVGPVMGGAIVEKASWRIIFWINLPICVPVAIVLFFTLKLPRPKGSIREKFRRIDILGSVVFQGFIIPIIIAFAWAGQGRSWVSGQVIGTILGSLAVGAVFLIIEWKVAPDPMMPLRLLKVRNVAASCVCHFCLGACIYSPLMFIPLWELAVRHATEINAGLSTLPLMIAMVVAAGVSGFITTRYGRFREQAWLCGVLIAAGNSLLLLYTPTAPLWQRIVFLGLTGLGLGFGVQTLIIAAQSAVGGLDMAATTVLILFMRTLGGIASLSILSSVFNTQIRSGADKLDIQFPAYAGFIGTTLDDQSVIGKASSLPPELLVGLTNMYHDAMHKVFLGLVPFSALMVLSTLFIAHIDLQHLRKKTIK
ncbi:hypothetical protein LPJ61_003075 [Coemansia biformis]|uniref:Major facilitator superfamily (MFS) profile domain-containing protein n=1 Tax=Coemansia biformis TaxID=1286918 RepID=A0A9W7Y783_9FUNG|nr:hypothetical protein LPJ61_003075 [Coemansia biformis]